MSESIQSPHKFSVSKLSSQLLETTLKICFFTNRPGDQSVGIGQRNRIEVGEKEVGLSQDPSHCSTLNPENCALEILYVQQTTIRLTGFKFTSFNWSLKILVREVHKRKRFFRWKNSHSISESPQNRTDSKDWPKTNTACSTPPRAPRHLQ